MIASVRIKMRRVATLLTLATCLFAGCSVRDRIILPQGDGGWTAEQRREEIALRAQPSLRSSASAAAVAVEPATLDLAEVIKLTLRQNRRIGEGKFQLDGAAARVRETRGRLLPATSASGRYTWYSDELGNQIPAAVLPPGESAAIIIRERDVGNLNGTISVPFDLSGEIWQALAAAQAGYRGEQARLWATTLDQQVAAVRAYFQVLEARKLRQVTEETIALDREQLGHADALLRSGRATKNDTLVAQVALSNAEQRLRQRDLTIRQAVWSLNQISGRPISAAADIVDVTRRPELPPIDEVLQSSREHNPLLVALLEEQQRLEASARSLERSRFPRFNGGGAIDYSSSDLLQPQEVGSGFIGFTWDLGTDTRREAQIAQTRAELERSRVTLERQLRELETAVRATHEAAAERLSALDAAGSAVNQAEENLRIRQQQYEAGRAQSDDVLRAQTLLAQQKAILASAIYQAHARRAELQQLMGLPIEELLAEWR